MTSSPTSPTGSDFRDAFTAGPHRDGNGCECLYAGMRRGTNGFRISTSSGSAAHVEMPETAELASTCSSRDSARIPRDGQLSTPSGRIEIFSERVAAFGYDDCPGHAAWIEPVEWLGSPASRRATRYICFPTNPSGRLHSQLDFGSNSQSRKIAGREPIYLQATDAAARGIGTGDVVRVFNDRGQCLAGAVVTDGVLTGVVQMSTGAWYDPVDPARDRQP